MNAKFKNGIIAGMVGILLTLAILGAAPREKTTPHHYQFEVIRINSDEYLLLRMDAGTGILEGGWVDIEDEADELEWVKRWTEFKKVD